MIFESGKSEKQTSNKQNNRFFGFYFALTFLLVLFEAGSRCTALAALELPV